MILLILLAIIIFPLIVHQFKWGKEVEKVEEAFTETSVKYLISIFFSIITSIVIALKANIPASSGHGGFVYIFGPGLIGILIMLIYIISLFVFPKKKLLFGIIAILINLGVGVYFMLVDL